MPDHLQGLNPASLSSRRLCEILHQKKPIKNHQVLSEIKRELKLRQTDAMMTHWHAPH